MQNSTLVLIGIGAVLFARSRNTPPEAVRSIVQAAPVAVPLATPVFVPSDSPVEIYYDASQNNYDWGGGGA